MKFRPEWSQRLLRKGVLVKETYEVFAAWDDNLTEIQNLKATLAGRYQTAGWEREIESTLQRRLRHLDLVRPLIALAKSGIGSANPSGPAWLGKESRGNYEAMVILRGGKTEESEDEDEVDDSDSPEAKQDAERRRDWNDIVGAVRPRITRLLRQLSNRLDENRSAKWKYERVLLSLALLKRLRKFHPGQLPTVGIPVRLVDDDQVRLAFKMAMRCCFVRDTGIVAILDRAGGVEAEHDAIGRALLLWAAYEAGTDAAEPSNFNVEPEKLRAIQCDRTDALIAAIAASASRSVLERARRELFDRGEWREPRDRLERLEKWFNRHSQIGLKLQMAIGSKRPACLPVTMATPSIRDILVWKAEPGWPRLPQLISGRTVHLSDVGDVMPVKVTQQFVQVVDVKSLGLNGI